MRPHADRSYKKRRKRRSELTMHFYWILFVSSLEMTKKKKNGKSWQSETRSTNDLENQLETDASDFFLLLLLRLDGDSFAGYT